MILRLTILTLLALVTSVSDTDYYFNLNRYGWMTFSDGATPEVKVIQSGKQEQEDIVYQAKLRKVSDGTFKAPDGTVFTLKKLDKKHPGDENDRYDCNSGHWQLELSGEGAEIEETKKKFAMMYSWGKTQNRYYGDPLKK